MKKTLLVLMVCLAGAASADQMSLAGFDFLAVANGGNLGAGSLYNISPTQGEIDSLLKFDLSPFSENPIANGTLTITDNELCCDNHIPGNLDDSFSADIYIYSLTAAYDPNSATLADVPYSAATLLDTELYDVPSSLAQVPLTFSIPSALLEQWANDPSSNYGFIIVESGTYDTTGASHSDLGWITSGPGAPVLSFDASVSTPEPTTLFLIAPILGGLYLGRRKKLTAGTPNA